MPLNDERPSGSEDPSSDAESSSERSDSLTSSSDADSSSSSSSSLRQSFNSDRSSKDSSPSSSPPKTITLDDVMSSARDLSNLMVAHEIIVNRDFHVEQPNPPPDSLWKHVKDMVHKAFWDILESELSEDPPEYEYAIKLLEEIREVLLSFLNPGTNRRVRTQILEVLDMDLIRQQADNQVVDIQGLASYIVSTMAIFCAPARDDEVKKLQDRPGGDVVTMFKEIFRVLDLMKMDMVNYTIHSLRPELQRGCVDYERATFQNVLDKTPSALDHTTAWILASLKEVVDSMPPPEQGKGVKALPNPHLVFNTAYIRLLTWDYHKNTLPETLVTDEGRLQALQRRLQVLQGVAAVLLIVYSAVGGAIVGLSDLADRLKRMTSVLLEGMHSPSFNLQQALEGASAQICSELNKSLVERKYPALTSDLQATLRGQIRSIAQELNPIRCLVEGRVQQYFRFVLSTANSHVTPPPTPGGLALVQPELTALALSFIRLVKFNKEVYFPFYMDILKGIFFSAAPPPQDPMQSDPVTSN